MADIAIHHDKIINTMARLKSREADRASDTGEDRETIGAMLDLTGINKKAFAFARALDKMEPDKREDVLRSLHPLLDMLDSHWNGNRTPDMFDGSVDPDDEPLDDDPEDDEGEFDDEIADEANAFEAHLAQVAEAAE